MWVLNHALWAAYWQCSCRHLPVKHTTAISTCFAESHWILVRGERPLSIISSPMTEFFNVRAGLRPQLKVEIVRFPRQALHGFNGQALGPHLQNRRECIWPTSGMYSAAFLKLESTWGLQLQVQQLQRIQNTFPFFQSWAYKTHFGWRSGQPSPTSKGGIWCLFPELHIWGHPKVKCNTYA